MPAVKAIPAVAAAPPGIVTYADPALRLRAGWSAAEKSPTLSLSACFPDGGTIVSG